MRLPSHGTVVAYLALFVALSGTTYAATKLGKNTVGARQIKTGAVSSSEIKNGSLLGKDIKKSTLTGREISESKLGAVPKAGHATTAGSATTASTAGRASSAASADTAARLGGLGPSSFLSADHVRHGKNVDDVPGALVLSDPRTGIEIRTATPNSNQILVANTNASARVVVSGLISRADGTSGHDNNLGRVRQVIPAGADGAKYTLNTVEIDFADLIIFRDQPGAQAVSHITCGRGDGTGTTAEDGTFDCVAVG